MLVNSCGGGGGSASVTSDGGGNGGAGATTVLQDAKVTVEKKSGNDIFLLDLIRGIKRYSSALQVQLK